jgi:hypothetical protein
MKRPAVHAPQISPRVEHVFRNITDRFEEENRLREVLGYTKAERGVLDEALGAARKYPDFASEIWNSLSEGVKQMNVALDAIGAPPLRCVPYDAFLAAIKSDLADRDPR